MGLVLRWFADASFLFCLTTISRVRVVNNIVVYVRYNHKFRYLNKT